MDFVVLPVGTGSAAADHRICCDNIGLWAHDGLPALIFIANIRLKRRAVLLSPCLPPCIPSDAELYSGCRLSALNPPSSAAPAGRHGFHRRPAGVRLLRGDLRVPLRLPAVLRQARHHWRRCSSSLTRQAAAAVAAAAACCPQYFDVTVA